MTRILTPYEYIIKLISAYPSLYAAPTREAAIFKIMDQTFNTIGNGVEFENFDGDTIAGFQIEYRDFYYGIALQNVIIIRPTWALYGK